MEADIKQHLTRWAKAEFTDDDKQREETIKLLTDLWDSDESYWSSHNHSWWELLDIAKRIMSR